LRCQLRVACARHDAPLAWGTTCRLALATTRRNPAQATRPRRWRCQRCVACAGHDASLRCQRRVACARHDASFAKEHDTSLSASNDGSLPSASDAIAWAARLLRQIARCARSARSRPTSNIGFARPLRPLRFCNTFCHPVLAVRWQRCCSKLAATRGS